MGHFIAALLGKLCADEVKAWLPAIAERITQCAVRFLAKELRERYSEEWRSHLDEVPGDLAKIWVAYGFFSAATRISSRIAASLLFLAFSPVIVLMRLISYFDQRTMYRFPLTMMNERVESMPVVLRQHFESLGYPSSQRLRVEAWVKSREIPLARLLHESLKAEHPLGRIFVMNPSELDMWGLGKLYSLPG